MTRRVVTDPVVTPEGGERDLARLLADLRPVHRPGAWVYATVDELPPDVVPEATVREAEGRSVVVEQVTAEAAGWSFDGPFAWITLQVHSALDGVGLTAAVAAALGEQGISANVIAGRYHDHVLVPAATVDRAVDVLRRIGQDRG